MYAPSIYEGKGKRSDSILREKPPYLQKMDANQNNNTQTT